MNTKTVAPGSLNVALSSIFLFLYAATAKPSEALAHGSFRFIFPVIFIAAIFFLLASSFVLFTPATISGFFRTTCQRRLCRKKSTWRTGPGVQDCYPHFQDLHFFMPVHHFTNI